MTPPTPSLALALAPLFQALDDTEALLRLLHPDLPLGDSPLGDSPSNTAPHLLLADTVLALADNLRAAARAYHREQHLLALLPPP